MLLQLWTWASKLLALDEAAKTRCNAHFSIEGKAFAKEYSDDKAGADKKYLDKVIEVTAEVRMKDYRQKPSVVYLLTTAPTIQCEFVSDQQQYIDLVEAGDIVTIRGIVRGKVLPLFINLTGCRIVSPPKNS